VSAGTSVAPAPPAKRPAVTLSRLAEKKALGEPIAMVTAYDHPSAQVAEAAGVDAFAEDVRERRYPEPEHGYTMAPDEVERLRGLLGDA
jgi:ketopantoate hydroxymethyltransferase